MLESGGTLAPLLACHALRRGYGAVIFTYDLRLFDPTWFAPGLARRRCTARELWGHLAEMFLSKDEGGNRCLAKVLNVILDQGTLARRILHRVGNAPSRETIRRVYRELCACLAEGRMFL